jgi:phosphoribosylformylglycinamidine cyclo-ligase
MADESLTYRGCGVDVEANLEANRRIQAYTLRTHSEDVLTRGGLFGGALGLGGFPQPPESVQLVGGLIAAEGESPEQVSRRIVRSCRSRLSAEIRPVAFLDYLAASRMEAGRAADLVGLFSESFAATPRIPIIGGETAEMPDVFQDGAWEIVGALFAAQAAEAHSEAGASGAAAQPRISLASLRNREQPVLVFSMDGVGTKTKIGVATRSTSGLALDIVHHSLDDILCQGARGLGFMLYLGCHSRDEELVEPLLNAAQACCRSNGMVLLDRLVAEKPSLYRPGEIDVCGTIVGVVDADRLIQGNAIRPGDILIGLPSSGLHTNGFSLARKALLERAGLPLDRYIEELGATLGQALLEPHRNYAPLILPLLEDAEIGPAIGGIAHVTGGGLMDNLERILPQRVCAEIRTGSWQPPPVFELIRCSGNIPLRDAEGGGMYESFNMGIGLVLVVAPDYEERILGRLRHTGEEAVVIGRVLECAGGAPAVVGDSAREGGAPAVPVGSARAEGTDKGPAESEQRVRLL